MLRGLAIGLLAIPAAVCAAVPIVAESAAELAALSIEDIVNLEVTSVFTKLERCFAPVAVLYVNPAPQSAESARGAPPSAVFGNEERLIIAVRGDDAFGSAPA